MKPPAQASCGRGRGRCRRPLTEINFSSFFSRGSPVLRKSFEQLANTYMIRVTLGIKYCYTSPGASVIARRRGHPVCRWLIMLTGPNVTAGHTNTVASMIQLHLGFSDNAHSWVLILQVVSSVCAAVSTTKIPELHSWGSILV